MPQDDERGNGKPLEPKGVQFPAELEIRDYFAAKALALPSISWGTGFTPDDCRVVSERAYKIADAMLAWRKGGK